MEIAYLKVAEIAKMTGLRAEVIRRWCRSGMLKASKPGGKDYLVKKSDFDKFMDESAAKGD